jgi:hypothetical protein
MFTGMLRRNGVSNELKIGDQVRHVQPKWAVAGVGEISETDSPIPSGRVFVIWEIGWCSFSLPTELERLA